jgi:hypothetical protein
MTLASVLVAAVILSAGSGKILRQKPGAILSTPNTITPALFTDDANTVCHPRFNGSSIVDSKGCAWTMVGTVPMVPRSGRVPPGAGPFSTANRITLGTGNEPLDFAAAWYACAIYKPTATATQILFNDSNGTTTGYYIAANPGTGRILTFFDGAGHGLNSATTKPVASTINCICVGRDGGAGGNAVGIVNDGALVALTANQNPATSSVATIGTDGTSVADGTLYELIFQTGAPSLADLQNKCAQAKSRLEVSSW